jgi:hypothetical protein
MMKPILAAAVILISSPAAHYAFAQEPIKVERERVVSKYGEVETAPLTLAMSQGVGRVAMQNIRRNGAKSLRFHFQVDFPMPHNSWVVEFRDGDDNKLGNYSPSPGEKEFWSRELRSDRVMIYVLCTEDVSRLKLTIDRLVVTRSPSQPQASSGRFPHRPITAQPQSIQQLGKAVARILFISGGKLDACTGFLVSPDLILTNNHCIRTPGELEYALAEFDYDSAKAEPEIVRFNRIVITKSDEDFSLLELTEPIARKPLAVDVAPPAATDTLLLIQHPGGQPKQVSVNCPVMGLDLPGVTARLTDFGHDCDTLGGSSGAPVLNATTFKVIGLHHLGYTETSNRLVNRAVKMKEVMDKIKDEQRTIHDGILGSADQR